MLPRGSPGFSGAPSFAEFAKGGGVAVRLLPLLLFFVASAAAVQAPNSRWSAWQPAMIPDGSPHPAIQFRWRSDPPCTDIGCRLAVQIRNTSHVPMLLHCFVYVDAPPLPYEDEVRPVMIDVSLKPSGFHGSKQQTGDTTRRLVITGVRITGVVVRSTTPK